MATQIFIWLLIGLASSSNQNMVDLHIQTPSIPALERAINVAESTAKTSNVIPLDHKSMIEERVWNKLLKKSANSEKPILEEKTLNRKKSMIPLDTKANIIDKTLVKKPNHLKIRRQPKQRIYGLKDLSLLEKESLDTQDEVFTNPNDQNEKVK
jgi:hypothetical protein